MWKAPQEKRRELELGQKCGEMKKLLRELSSLVSNNEGEFIRQKMEFLVDALLEAEVESKSKTKSRLSEILDVQRSRSV